MSVHGQRYSLTNREAPCLNKRMVTSAHEPRAAELCRRKMLDNATQVERIAVYVTAVIILSLTVGIFSQEYRQYREEAPHVWTQQDEVNRMHQLEATKEYYRVQAVIKEGCGDPPSQNYPDDSEVPLLHAMNQLEQKAQYDYGQCVPEALRNDQQAKLKNKKQNPTRLAH